MLWLSALLPSSARAYEDQLSVGAGAGYAYATQAGRAGHDHGHGAYVQLEASLGLSTVWSLRGIVGFAEHPTRPSLAQGLVAAEALYLVDVLELVPYAGIGVDALAGFTATDTHFAVGAHPVFGIDWLLGRSFLLGLSVRPVFILSDLVRGPLYLSSALTAAWLLDL